MMQSTLSDAWRARVAACTIGALGLASLGSGCVSRPAPLHEGIVSAAWVADLIAHGRDHVILDNRGDGLKKSTDTDYRAGHIPGALHVSFHQFNRGRIPPRTPDDTNLLPDPELRSMIGALGISRDTTVVLYGDFAPFTARIAWALLYAGVADVQVLDGGFEAWVEHGGDVVAGVVQSTAVPPLSHSDGHPELLARTGEVRASLRDPDAALMDIRERDEFMGDDPTHPFLERPGHIPGAVLGNWKSWLTPHGTFRDLRELEQEWATLGISREKSTIFY